MYKYPKNANQYSMTLVKRRKVALCKNCNKIIIKGENAVIIECDDYFSGIPNVIAITCLKCPDEFIKNDLEKNNR